MNRYFQTQTRPFVHAGEIFLPSPCEFRFAETLHRSMADIAVIAGIASAAVSISAAGYAAAGGGQPTMPNLASSSRQVAYAQANALPLSRQIAATEQEGGTTDQWVPQHKEPTQFIKYKLGTDSLMDQVIKGDADKDSVFGAFASGGLGPIFGLGSKDQYAMIKYNAADWQPGGKYYRENDPNFAQEHLVTRPVSVKGHMQHDDFTGFGTADIEGKLAKQMAEQRIKLGEKYGKQFAEQATAEARMADPLGFAARDKEYDLLQDQQEHPMPINPLSGTLQDQIDSQLNAGSGLDQMSRDVLEHGIAGAIAARGGGPSADSVEGNMSTGMEGASRREAGITKAQQFVGSGATPADIEYRRNQQNMADLSAFVNGQSPESQFQALSGAAQGATPFVPGQQLPQQPNNAGTVGPAYSLAAWQQNLRNSGQGANWMAGLGAALGGVGATANKIGGVQ